MMKAEGREGSWEEGDYWVTVCKDSHMHGSQVPSPLQCLKLCRVSNWKEWKTVFVLCHVKAEGLCEEQSLLAETKWAVLLKMPW